MPRAKKEVIKKSPAKKSKSAASELKVIPKTRKAPVKTEVKRNTKTSERDFVTKIRGYFALLSRKLIPSVSSLKNYKSSKGLYIGLAVAGLFLLALYRKDLIIAATVNGSPISNFEVLSRLNDQYRTQTLNQMVNEKIILDEARKSGVSVSENEINERISEVEKSVGGPQALETLLTQQGQSRASLKNQMKIQLTVEKMFASSAAVSPDEVSSFIEQNKDSLQATTSAEQQKEATDIIKQQKLSKVFQEKFQEWKQQAKVKIF